MRKTKKTLAILALVAMVLTMLPMQLFAADSNRIYGADRYETAIEIAKEGWANGAETVVLAAGNDENLVDALAAASLAGQENAPILLTPKAALNSKVANAIKDLGAKKVYLIGAAKGLESAVKALGVDVTVLAGNDRWETAAKINAQLKDVKGTFVVAYNGLADALSVASYAAANGFQVVLAKADGTVASSELKGDVYTVGGGVKSISSEKGRFAGNDRFATNEEVVKGLSFKFDKVYVANGLKLVDALTAAPLAAKANAAILLASASDVKAASYVNEQLGADSVVIALGGTSAVSDSVVAKIKYNPTGVETVAVTSASYDDDTEDQYVAFTVNGKKADATALAADGWDVEFSAYDKKYNGTDKTATIFADTSTGLLKSDLRSVRGDYYVQVVLTKGSDVIASELQKITIKNLDVVASGIADYEATNTTGSFTQESTTLVVGDTVSFDSITVNIGSSKEDVSSGFSVKTSNAGVISKSGTTITAEAPGTATITLTYGNASKEINFKVVNDQRETTKLRVKKASDESVVSSLKIAIATGIIVEALDQYGDPSGTITAENVSNTGVATISGSAPEYTITPVAKGTTTISFEESGKKIGTLSVTVSDDLDVAKKTFSLWTPASNKAADDIVAGTKKAQYSTDATIDVSDDAYVVYQLAKFNAEGLLLGLEGDVDIDVVESTSGVIDAGYPQNVNNKIVVKAGKEGTATLKVTDNTTGKIYTQKITVVDQGYSIKSVSFKSLTSPSYTKTFNYKSVLNVTGSGGDPIVNGVTLNKATSHAIRIDLTTGKLYIDKDPDGDYTADDIDLGIFAIELRGTFANGSGTVPDIDSGITVVAGDDGTIIFKIYNPAGDKVLGSTSVKVAL